MRTFFTALLVFGCFLHMPFLLTNANAQHHDMWTGHAEKSNLFTPHINTCDTSEVFVTIDGGPYGYCIEKNRRSAQTWIAAKETCGALGKRLPEPAEWEYACANPPSGYGISFDVSEWASNSPTLVAFDSNPSGIGAPVMGFNSCYGGGYSGVARADAPSTGTSATNAFRCVH